MYYVPAPLRLSLNDLLINVSKKKRKLACKLEQRHKAHIVMVAGSVAYHYS